MNADVVPGSGNVFADLGLDNPEELQAKAMLSIHIEEAIKDGQPSLSSACEATGFTEAELTQIIRGDLDSFSVSQLIDCLNQLNHDIEIRVMPTKGRRGRLIVAAGRSSV